MSDHPHHPGSDAHTPTEHEPDAARGSSRASYVFAALVLLLVLGLAVLHLTGAMGPGLH